MQSLEQQLTAKVELLTLAVAAARAASDDEREPLAVEAELICGQACYLALDFVQTACIPIAQTN